MHPELVNKLNHVLDYIEQNLTVAHTLDALAGKASMSKFHFHRTFKIFTSETPVEYINRKRIERIASLLIQGRREKLSELSFQYGFENFSSFSRSFKKYYGFSASHLRQKMNQASDEVNFQNSKIGITTTSREEYLCSVKEWVSDKTNISTQYISEKRLAYVRHWGSPYTIHEAFEKLLSWYETINEKPVEENFYTLFHDDPSLTIENKIQQSACVLIEDRFPEDKGISILTIPQQKYAIGRFVINESEFELAWNSVIVRMNENNITSVDGYRFERFANRSLFNGTSMFDVEIAIPIK